MISLLIFFGVYVIVLVVGTLYYLNRKEEQLAEAVSQETKEIRQFFTLAHHAEGIVKNANAETVSKYLLQIFTEIAHNVKVGNVDYFIDRGVFFDPKEHGTLQYAIVARGMKSTAMHGFRNPYTNEEITERPPTIPYITSDPKLEEIDMFVITISQGGENKSRVTFDTNIREIFLDISNGLFQDLREVFKIGRIMRY